MTGHPAARAEAVSPPATENASGKLLAPKTATGPRGTLRRRRSARGNGLRSGRAGSIRRSSHSPTRTTSAKSLSCPTVRARSPSIRPRGSPVSAHARSTSASPELHDVCRYDFQKARAILKGSFPVDGKRRPRQGTGALHLRGSCKRESGLKQFARCRVYGPKRTVCVFPVLYRSSRRQLLTSLLLVIWTLPMSRKSSRGGRRFDDQTARRS